jgi:26S proteasome non-ATPase regulatory subunit 9
MSARDRLNRLLAQREALEIEAEAIASELTSKGPNGQPPAGIRDPLVDSEGFPRGDIDLFNVKAKRQRLSVINTDHKALMAEVERTLLEVQSELPLFVSRARANNGDQITEGATQGASTPSDGQQNTRPFAKVDEILPGSPAYEAGLVDGDELLQFGRVTAVVNQALDAIPGVVRENVNLPIQIVVRRNGISVSLHITPKSWGGRGLLGCHLSPLTKTQM